MSNAGVLKRLLFAKDRFNVLASLYRFHLCCLIKSESNFHALSINLTW